MTVQPGQTAVVAGNGQSLSQIVPGTVLAEDFILRTNSFFFEREYYLGRRVDLAVVGGDPRVSPFVFETLWRCREQYQIQQWSSVNPRVVRAGKRRFSDRFQPMRYRDKAIENRVNALCKEHARKPTTGVVAVLLAHALGAEKILLVGMDFYKTSQRYVYCPGPNYRALMGEDVGKRGIDGRLHDPKLDLEILSAVNARDDVILYDATGMCTLQGFIDPAPIRTGRRPEQGPHDAPTDWAPRAGLYPIGLLKALRRGRVLQRRLFNGGLA